MNLFLLMDYLMKSKMVKTINNYSTLLAPRLKSWAIYMDSFEMSNIILR